MSRRLTYVLLVLTTMLLAACEAMTPVVEGVSGDRVEFGSHCINLRMQCDARHYSEWIDDKQQQRCSCRDYLDTGAPKL